MISKEKILRMRKAFKKLGDFYFFTCPEEYADIVLEKFTEMARLYGDYFDA